MPGLEPQKKCRHCQFLVRHKAEKCPSCGGDLRIWFARPKVLAGILGCFVLIVIIAAASGNKGKESQKTANNQPSVSKPAQVSTQPSKAEPQPSPPVKKWYEGGTLHKSTILEWRSASVENRLATSADMASVSKKVQFEVKGDMEKLKPYALQMLACVDEASSGQGYENMQIADLATGCILIMWGE